MNENIEEILAILLRYGNISPKTIVSLFEDLGFSKREIQTTIQIGLDYGKWKLDKNLHITTGKLKVKS